MTQPGTNFPNGVYSYGVPLFPAGIPITQGKVIHCRPGANSDGDDWGDDGNRGQTPQTAVKTLSRALALAEADKNDVVLLYDGGASASDTSTRLTSTLTWNKDLVHLIGISSNPISQRCRITSTSGGSAVTPMLNVTANGCKFANFQVFGGNTTGDLVPVQVTGDRNTFYNVHFAGMGDATLASTANACSLKIDGGGENFFDRCVIGLDTISRDGDAKGELWLDGGGARNWFHKCFFNSYISDTDHFHVTLEDTTAIDRVLVFEDCMFFSKSTNKAVTQASIFSIPAGISQGAILLTGNTRMASDGGTAAWDANSRGIIWNGQPDPASDGAGGVMVNL